MHNQKGFIYFKDLIKGTKIRLEDIKPLILKNLSDEI